MKDEACKHISTSQLDPKIDMGLIAGVMKTAAILKNRKEDTWTRSNDMCLCIPAWFWASGKMMQMYPALLYHRKDGDTFERYTSSENDTLYAITVRMDDLLQSIERAVNTATVYLMFLDTHRSGMLVPVVFMTRGTPAVREQTFLLCFTNHEITRGISDSLTAKSERKYKSCHIDKTSTASD